MSDPGKQEGDASGKPRQGHSAAEWITLVLSSLLIAGVAGAVIFFTVTRGDTPPSFTMESQPAETRGDTEGYYLPVTVTNTGDEPAQQIQVRVELQSGDQTETAVFTIELLAAGESEEGTAVFRTDPSQGEIQAVVESFV
jgi:uncharacterized protein (TIGR02588 family)